MCKQGAQVVADSIDGVQPGLTLMIMQTVGRTGRGLLRLSLGRGALRLPSPT